MAKDWNVEKHDPAPKYTLDQLRGIIAAGMSVTEARMLLDDGYSPEAVMELAQLQASQRSAAVTESQTATAKAMKKAMKPENEEHPGISAFRPKGGADPVLPYELFYNNYPASKFTETLHDRELELMGKVQPGVFTVMRKDGSVMEVTVKGTRDAKQTLEKINIEFPVAREDKDKVPPMTVVLYQLVYSDNPRRRFVEAMQEHLNLVFGDAVDASAVAAVAV